MYRSQKGPINTGKTGHSKGPKMAFTPRFTPLSTFYQSAGRAPPVISIVIISGGVFLLGRYQGSTAEGGKTFRRQAQGDSGSYPPEGVDLLQKWRQVIR